MAYFSFTKNILEGKPISVFNHGKLSRDFTYIDDIVNGLEKVINKDKNHQFSIYNIGNNKPVELIKFIHTIEKITGNQAVMEMKDMQPGDVFTTYADIDNFIKDFNYAPSTSIEDGMKNFINWYRIYFNI